MIKRIFDFCLSLLGILILIPVIIPVAIIVKLDTRGPVFFRQKRVGKNFVLFNIVKFRTMTIDVDSSGIDFFASKRITRSGRFLRKYKLDEIPQLYNILKGEMSFVGPRPEVPDWVDQSDVIWRDLLKIKPGLTDWSSLKYSDEEKILVDKFDKKEFYKNVILPNKLRISRNYVNNRTFLVDLLIILKTIIKILKK